MQPVYNFSPGPAMLPREVMAQVQAELLDYQGSGMSVMEISHRSDAFKAIAAETDQDLRDLLSIPDDYAVLLLAGGGRTQFASLPMSLAGGFPYAAYAQTGVWGQFAATEAKRFTDVRYVCDTQPTGYTSIPDFSAWRDFSEAAYLYYVDNETVGGVEFHQVPETGDVPLVSDMSSSLLTRPIDVSQYGAIFACAQKNLGPAGITVVIIRRDLMERQPLVTMPSILSYSIQDEKKSMLNTVPTFPWYVLGLVLKWVKQQGGVEEMGRRSQCKANKLYACLDQHDCFMTSVDIAVRSRMNVVFNLASEALEQDFLTQAQAVGLKNLKGHRIVGGVRASIYNGMPEEGVDRLVSFMHDYATSVASVSRSSATNNG